MRIITRSRLRAFWEQPNRQDAEEPLKAWFDDALRAIWRTPKEIKSDYNNASIRASNRVVFNIADNKYRLIVAIDYRTSLLLGSGSLSVGGLLRWAADRGRFPLKGKGTCDLTVTASTRAEPLPSIDQIYRFAQRV